MSSVKKVLKCGWPNLLMKCTQKAKVSIGRVVSCLYRIDKKNSDKLAMSGQPFYRTVQQILKPNSTHL